MNINEQLLTTFYQSFQNKDYASMQNSYADNAVFNDEVFKNLDAQQVKAMWEMLIKRGKDLQIEFKNIEADDRKGSAEWIATYTFSKTKRKIINRVKSEFIFEKHKILKHTDHFNFHKWSGQALGITGILLGWTTFLKQKISQTAMKSLSEYMSQNK